jgi:hypothetical protein
MDVGLVKGEGFAVDASVMEADASQTSNARSLPRSRRRGRARRKAMLS